LVSSCNVFAKKGAGMFMALAISVGLYFLFSLEYNDKLVYEIALNNFERAKIDPAYRADAERKISYVQPVAPTADDKFMHKDEKEPTGDCYSWIK